jgi:pimeloyl-ACP methyl ester carboxylesterase
MILLVLRFLMPLWVVLAGFTFAERFVIYAFDPRAVDPASLGLRLTVDQIESAEGDKIVLWRAPAKAGKPTILYFHGNAGNLANRHQRFAIILSRGYGLVAPAYPGSSGSDGWPTEARLIANMGQVYRGVTGGQITGKPVVPIVYGESLGAAVAAQVLRDARLTPPRAVVLEAPFSTLADVGRSLQSWAKVLTPLLTSQWNSVEGIKSLSAPLLVMHGDRDALIPIAQGRAVFQAAGSADKEFLEVKGAGHTNLWTVKSQRHIFAWMDRRAARVRVTLPDAVLRPKLPSQPRSR